MATGTVLATVPSSSSSAVYEIRLGGDGNVYCTCPAWKFQKLPPKERTCKHMKALSGQIASMVKKVSAPKAAAPAPVKNPAPAPVAAPVAPKAEAPKAESVDAEIAALEAKLAALKAKKGEKLAAALAKVEAAKAALVAAEAELAAAAAA